MALSLRRQIDNPAHTRKLEIRFQGERMLFAEWTDDGFTKRSYRSGVGKRGYVGTNEYPRWPGGSKQRHEARPTILAGGAAAGSSRELLRAIGPHVEGRLSDQADRVHAIKPRQSVSASSGKTMPDRGRVHFDLGNRQATFYPEVASDIDVVVRLLYLVEVISAKPTTAKIATGATTTISFRKNVPAMSIAGENCLPAVGEIQPMTMRIARRRIAPARARIKMIANSSPPCNTPEAAGFGTDGHYTRDCREEFPRGGS